ncbi:metabotropic glutamate receptor 1-like [Photinus pyralis]|nr:metabotropic glutamate receptor 1-like [Photinus pyralis]
MTKSLLAYTDGWADRQDVTTNYEMEAWGGISIRIHSPYVHDFDSYYLSLKPSQNIRNPWFKELWEARFNCTLNRSTFGDATNMTSVLENPLDLKGTSSRHPCTGNERLSQEYRQDPKLSFVIKAVYTFAYALQNMHQEICGDKYFGVCDKLNPFNGSLFKNYLLNVSFTYKDDIVEFDDNGDPPGRYDIVNYQRLADGRFDYVQVGIWNNRTLNWISDLQFGPHSSMESVCSAPCPHGHYKNVQQGGKDKRCCWVCVRCPFGEILDEASDFKSCQRCPLGTIPDKAQTVCLPLPIEHMQWFDTQAVVAIFFASLGFFITLFALIIFAQYSNTPVVKSSTKELSYTILAGMMISHASIFIILAKPTKMTCTLNRFIPGLSFAMIYAALLTKTNRISRILAGSKKRFPTRKPLFMSATAQIIITCFLIGIEVFISIGMLMYQEASSTHTYHPTRTVLECNTTPEGVVVPLAFDFLLIFFCTVYAVKTRNVPENFNEAKFIGFAMYTTCVIWIAFVPIYFGSDSKVITMCMCVTLSAMVTWIFLFIPKLYIILFRPEKNNRSFFTTSKNIRCHIGCRVSTAISEKSSINSWRDSSCSCRENEKPVKEIPQKRTLSCQTGVELLQVLLSAKSLMDMYSPSHTALPRITERDCCEADSCQMKKITIKLPNQFDANLKY